MSGTAGACRGVTRISGVTDETGDGDLVAADATTDGLDVEAFIGPVSVAEVTAETAGAAMVSVAGVAAVGAEAKGAAVLVVSCPFERGGGELSVVSKRDSDVKR